MNTQFQFPESAHAAIDANMAAGVGPRTQEQRHPGAQQPQSIEELLSQHAADPAPITPRPMSKPPIVRMGGAAEAPTVPVTQAPPTPMETADGISIDLPSRFHFYTFKDLYVKPLRTPQLAKFAKAHETGNLQTQVEAVSTLLSVPSGEANLAFRLTAADYAAVLYWLRLSSFPKPTMRVTSICENEKHHEAVRKGEKTQESLEIQTVVTRATMRTQYLETVPDPEYFHIMCDGIRIPLGPETMADTIDFLNHPMWADEEFGYKSKMVAVIKLDEATGHKWSWDQRIEFFDKYVELSDVVKINEFIELVDDYGVIETTETRCKGCGSKGITKISCDPLSFLSPQF
jgi:hypothetical protein